MLSLVHRLSTCGYTHLLLSAAAAVPTIDRYLLQTPALSSRVPAVTAAAVDRWDGRTDGHQTVT